MASVSAPNLCANCGKGEEESDNLKSCAACKLVKYCSRECQIAHRPQHKKECKKRVIELHEEKLFADPPPPEECPICMLPLSSEDRTEMYHSCCGKLICTGCLCAMMMSEGGADLCPYCRSPKPTSEEEVMQGTKKLMDKGNALAFFEFANYYGGGTMGLTRDRQKANELYLKAGELGYAQGYFNLGNSYDRGYGVEVDIKKAKHYQSSL